MTAKRNWFDTLNSALEAEGLLHTWDGMTQAAISYGETRAYHFEDEETGAITYISIFRDNNGRYERPVHYRTN